jgi:Fe-Mn family superoxide dismutase
MKGEFFSFRLAKLALTPVTEMRFAAEGGKTSQPAVPASEPIFKLAALPYSQDALEPQISARTVSFHYGKHHQTYVDNLNKMIAGTLLEKHTLEKIVCETAGLSDKSSVFNNAAQVWNHDFYWKSVKPGGGGKPGGRLMQMIDKSFGGYDAFKNDFVNAALAQFGSGWVWLVQEGEKVKIMKTSNADTPLAHEQNALMTCDVWEHAYYLDYQNRRKDYVLVFLDKLVNWDFAASRLN